MASTARGSSGIRAEFVDRLAVGGEAWRPERSDWALLAGLFLLCLAPRLLMAWKLDAACDDAYYYVFVANCLRRGDFGSALDYLNLNVYPAILLGLHQLGFDWIIGGKFWGALAASLTVLPMFGWVRRMFDDRVAATAGFLYAIHPQLGRVDIYRRVFINEARQTKLKKFVLCLSYRVAPGESVSSG